MAKIITRPQSKAYADGFDNINWSDTPDVDAFLASIDLKAYSESVFAPSVRYMKRWRGHYAERENDSK